MSGFYRGRRFQRGYGLGNTLRSLFRMSIPVMKAAAKVGKKQLLKTSSKMLNDMSKGKTLKDTLRSRLVPPGIPVIGKRKVQSRERKKKRRGKKVMQDIFQRQKL